MKKTHRIYNYKTQSVIDTVIQNTHIEKNNGLPSTYL